MRIGIYTELYSPSVGGQELFFEGLSRQLVRQGHEVCVHCIGHDVNLERELIIDGIHVYRDVIDPIYKTPYPKWKRRSWSTICRFALSARNTAKKNNYDVLILNQWPLLHAAMLTRRCRHRSILHWCEIRTGIFYRFLQMWLPNYVSFNAAISQAVAGSLSSSSKKPVYTLPSGIDLNFYKSYPKYLRSGIIFLGRLTEHKNITLLIDAFETLKSRGYRHALTIAGDGPFFETIATRVKMSPNAADIVLSGLISEDEKVDLLARSEILAMPSKREGFPRVIAEAMASGTPVVTSAYPENGSKDIVDQFKCGVVTETSVTGFALGVEAGLRHWDELSKSGIAGAKVLGWAQIGSNLEDELLSDIVRRRRHR